MQESMTVFYIRLGSLNVQYHDLCEFDPTSVIIVHYAESRCVKCPHADCHCVI